MKRMADVKPFVSIVIPCRNEAECICACLDSVAANDYPKEKMEVLVVDGMSDDGTRETLRNYSMRHPWVRMLDNTKREQQLALNIGITEARGDVIIRMDAHSTYKSNYVSECIKALNNYDADNVGGRWITVPRDKSIVGKAICMATTCIFGVGNAYYRLTSLCARKPLLDQPRWEINVAYFCCRKEVFEKIGLFNERLDRSEDIDFRSRLKRAGYRTLFVPTIECYYNMRTRYRDFVRHMFKNGQWVLLPLNHSPNISFSKRHIVPLFFVTINLVVLAIALIYPPFWYILLFGGIAYLVTNLFFSLVIAIREREILYALLLPWVFFTLHVSYGVGSVDGMVRLSLHWLSKALGFGPGDLEGELP